MTTILKKSSNDGKFEIFRRPSGLVLRTPLRLIQVPDGALESGISVLGGSLSYVPAPGKDAILVEVGTHEEAREVLSMLAALLEAEENAPMAPAISATLPAPALAPVPKTDPVQEPAQGASSAPLHVSRASRLKAWLRGKGRWRVRLVYLGIALFTFWLFYPDDGSSISASAVSSPASLSLNPAATQIEGPLTMNSQDLPQNQLSPEMADPLAAGLVPADGGVVPPAVTASQIADQPYTFKPNLVRPPVEMPELKCD